MNQEDIIRMARESHIDVYGLGKDREKYITTLERFAALIAAARDAEHKEAMRWDVHSCGPTCKRYACVAIREAVAAAKAEEREAFARKTEEFARKWWKIHCDSNLHYSSTLKAHQDFCALQAAIRARGETK